MHNGLNTHDAATEFSLKYLRLVEQHLRITWNDEGIPTCITDWIDARSIEDLRSDLSEMMHGEDANLSLSAATEYGRIHIQAIGFGLAPDVEELVKIGLIYGERVVLWDVIYSRVLAEKESAKNRKHLIAEIGCNLLLLKSAVARGAVIILPHPIVWSGVAAEIYEELGSLGSTPSASLGLSMALAAIEEGLPLHPYTLLQFDQRPPQAANALQGLQDELFTRENFRFQQCLTTLIRDVRVGYLAEVSVEMFLDVLSDRCEFRRTLRRHFSNALSGLSEQQAESEIRHSVDDLFALFEKQRQGLEDYAAEVTDATAKALLFSSSKVVLDESLLATLACMGGAAVYLTTAVRKLVRKPSASVIVHAFKALEGSAPVKLRSISEMENHLSSYRAVPTALKDVYEKFVSFHWTEERHHFLESLPIEVAKALLTLLTPGDLDAIVNTRRFQEDYIGDYLAFISEIDKAVYWEHLAKTFESPEGLLVYDDDAHIESMEQEAMPAKAWALLLGSLFECYAKQMRARDYHFPLERFPQIVRFQTECASDFVVKREMLIQFASSLHKRDRASFTHFMKLSYSDGLPTWFSPSGTGSPSRRG